MAVEKYIREALGPDGSNTRPSPCKFKTSYPNTTSSRRPGSKRKYIYPEPIRPQSVPVISLRTLGSHPISSCVQQILAFPYNSSPWIRSLLVYSISFTPYQIQQPGSERQPPIPLLDSPTFYRRQRLISSKSKQRTNPPSNPYNHNQSRILVPR
ncbi:hypothetical protein BDV32DRAFT_66782 [Aspergillus pseudonomiae]|uniref:Uncharacterized protein n=1 Tax=Aspergillus pseudonomiae TaxID=1506151 RepID=A0A5N7DC59_9EURO|nr:uncharacterized protein BDV37DRAFT_142416 [Aspergillus pseudonomiae]KAB8258809.1 hypothetical protein BDV32DRAFT_66782 [Aspergillus pseudonomiae]KAE8403358.1 hypothetical protein BDV37DRAFT_142416 [Aspergillus pseudonomiae]